MSDPRFLLACVMGLFVTGAAGFLWRRGTATAIVYGGCLLLCLALLLGGLLHLLSGAADGTLSLPLGLPWIGSHFRIDPLSGLFLVVVNLGGAMASLFGLGYGRHEQAPTRVLPFFPLFLGGMSLVLLADDAWTFLLSWEFMSLTSWALVLTQHREPQNRWAGQVYLVMAGFGTLALLLAFGLLAGPEGGYTFAAMREADVSAGLAGSALILVLLGAGSKAGLVPLHVWLPLAHPAAPSHVSALMSGVMTKVAVYGFVRIVFDLMPDPAWWWGALVLLLGGVTAVLGVLYALMQHDLKRLLAYHTVENLGIVFIGLGLALAFRANGLGAGAALALTAALFHVFNHSVFKSLLFFGSGAVLGGTGERDMERLGGLIHRMPLTAVCFLVGAAAISALPPLNGFVSEWLTFQAILIGPELPQWLLRFLVPAVGAMLALSAALAATCFVKAFGITFLGRPRTKAAETAVETDRWSLGAMGCLTLLCILAGVLPGPVIDGISTVVGGLTGESLPPQSGLSWLSVVPSEPERSAYSGVVVLVCIGLAAGFAAFALKQWGSHGTRREPAWDCGFCDPVPDAQYSASSFAQPIRRVFGSVVFKARERVHMPLPGDMRPATLEVSLRDPVWEYCYAPVIAAVERVAGRLNQSQFLTIRRYLTLVFAVLILLLTGLAIWQ